MRIRPDRVPSAVLLDVAVIGVGALVGASALLAWALDGPTVALAGVVSIVLIAVMSRFPLALALDPGDVAVGFESCVLVFLALTRTPLEAFLAWTVATVLGRLGGRAPWRARVFDMGVTILGGVVFVSVVALIDPQPDQLALQMVAVALACGLYVGVDLLLTVLRVALEEERSILAVVSWPALLLGLACFASVDSLAYLAALHRQEDPVLSLVLLLVPAFTILVGARAFARNRAAHRRLVGLLEAATHAPDWTDEEHIEQSLLIQAQRTLHQSTAELREAPPVAPEIGVPIDVEGRPARHLVVSPTVPGQAFDRDDREALEALSAVGMSALNRRRLTDEMTYLARHDALTGLHNRGVFTERLGQALERRAPRGQVAALYCDLDGFKEVNDLFGHDAGDRLLVLVAQRIMLCLREQDTAARLGGDEFGIIIDDLTGESQAGTVADRLLESLSMPFRLDDREIRVQVSIGISVSPAGAVSAEELIVNADTAMYVAKSLGKARVEWFVPQMREAERGRLHLETALREAVADDRIRVHYQPVVDLHTGRIDGFEALARWTHPTLGAVGPDAFIAAAERVGAIRTLGLQLLERAHEGGRQLVRAAGRPLSLGVNLSAVQVTDPELEERVTELQAWKPDVRLVLELTEGILLGDDAATMAALHRLKAAGVRLAIDDFGMGYSSVGYLDRLPVDILKIDKLFVSKLTDPRSHALVQGVVSMARAMHLTVITEGLEDWASALAVRELGCDLGQGFVLGHPLELGAAIDLVCAGEVDVAPILGPSAEARRHADR